MGQIVPFPAAAPGYPASAEALDEAEAVLLLAIRWWVAAVRHDEDPVLRLELGLGRARLLAAAPPLHAMMTVLARAAQRRIEIHCPRCPALSADEARLLDAASLAQARERAMAMQALMLVLGGTHGADFAFEPLEGLGALFAAAGRMLRRRRLPGGGRTAHLPPAAAPNPWPPTSALQ